LILKLKMVDFNEYDPDLEQINTLVNGLKLSLSNTDLNLDPD